MALSKVVIPGDGSTTLLTVNFAMGQIDASHVTCYVTGEVDGGGNQLYRSFTFLTGSSVQVAGTAAPEGEDYVFTRTVPKSTLIVDYNDGDGITADNLDKMQKQSMMAIHELLDGRFNQLTGPLDLGGNRIINVGDPIADTDGANKKYVDETTGTLAGIADEIIALAPVADDIAAIGGIPEDISTVASISSDVVLLAANADIITANASALAINEYVFTGNGVTTEWELDRIPMRDENILVWVNGAIQTIDKYSINGNGLVITPAVPDTQKIVARVLTLLSATELLDLIAEAEASKDAAAASAVAANLSAVSAANSAASINNLSGFAYYEDLTAFRAATVPSNIIYAFLSCRFVGHNRKALVCFKRWGPTEPPMNAVASRSCYQNNVDGIWWTVEPDPEGYITASSFGAHTQVLFCAETLAWYTAWVGTKPTFMHAMTVDRAIRRLKWRGLWDKLKVVYAFANGPNGKINLKSPGTLDCTITLGTGAYTNQGLKGDGVTTTGTHAIIAPWSSLVGTNTGFITAGYIVDPNMPDQYIISSETGTSAGVALTARATTFYVAGRLNSGATMALSKTTRTGRNGRLALNRPDATKLEFYEDGRWVQDIASAAIAPSAINAQLLGSGSGKCGDTITYFACSQQSLNIYDVQALDFIMEDLARTLPGVIDSGPTCDEINFTPATADLNYTRHGLIAAAKYAQMIGAKGVKLDKLGTYTINGEWLGSIRSNVEIVGVSRKFCILASTSTSGSHAMLLPNHYLGGERSWSIHGFTLDQRTHDRAVTIGSSRPGPSAISVNGSHYGKIYDMDVLDGTLHNIDLCNTGELTGSSRDYAGFAYPERANVGVRSVGVQVWDILSENPTDDHITTHYADGIGYNGFIKDVYCLYTSGRHTGGAAVSHAVEIDDGSGPWLVDGVYGLGNGCGVGAKNHDPNYSPRGCIFRNVTLEYTGRGVQLIDFNFKGEGHHLVENLIYKWPREWVTGHEIIAININGSGNNVVNGFYIEAQGNETYLRPAIYLSGTGGGCFDNKISNGHIKNWKSEGVSTQRGTIMVHQYAADTMIDGVTIEGAGLHGVLDVGSLRPDYSRISASGSGIASSVAFKINAATDGTDRALKSISGFTTARA